jgi:hypothetical protein
MPAKEGSRGNRGVGCLRDASYRNLDAAVAATYGWPADLSDEEILARLFELNQARAGRSRVAAV